MIIIGEDDDIIGDYNRPLWPVASLVRWSVDVSVILMKLVALRMTDCLMYTSRCGHATPVADQCTATYLLSLPSLPHTLTVAQTSHYGRRRSVVASGHVTHSGPPAILL